MARSTLTSKGQITLPLVVRERLGLQQGDTIEFAIQRDGRVLLEPQVRAITRLSGLLGHLGATRMVSDDAMRDAVRGRARQKYGRRRR